MRKSLLSLLMFAGLLVAGCGQSDSDVIGKWSIDADALKKSMSDIMLKDIPKDAPAEAKKMAEEELDKQVKEMASKEFEFKADHTVTGPMGDGTWALKDGQVTVTPKDGPAESATLSSGTLTFKFKKGANDKDEMTFVLKKK